MDKNLIETNIVVQVAFVVNNVEKTSQVLADFFGVEKPALIITDPFEITGAKYMGNPTRAIAKIVVFHVGPNLDLELLEPNHEPSTWRKELDKNGEGFHHLGFRIQDMDKRIQILKKNNFKLIQKGLCGDRETSYAYFETKSELKFILELLGK